MNTEKEKYVRPTMQIFCIEPEAAILAGSVDLSDWGDGGSLGGGEAAEGISQRRGEWGNLWSNN
ncbi:hypothetical protein SFC43_05370 [Bacteroides sp. CR5/BHMF/2]|nr:hypothetical protein [Bacteroides sp. CR5/BHMF/2]